MIGPVSSPPSGPQSGPRSLPRWSRAAAVAAIGLVGAALIAMVWTTRKSVLDARATLLRGQAAEAHGLIRARMMELADAPTEERVDAAFDAAAGQHVRYLALLDADDRIVAEAGVPRADRAELVAWAIAAAPATPEQVGERVRVVFKRIRRPDKDEPGAPPPSPPATAPATARWGRRRAGRRHRAGRRSPARARAARRRSCSSSIRGGWWRCTRPPPGRW
ncbi:MAG: hypothetical protein HS111_04955 [Kofleriaceae bacterium]|nr:hypothetical protein [Kofleriaceae bacterium]